MNRYLVFSSVSKWRVVVGANGWRQGHAQLGCELSPALPQRKSALLYWKTKEEEVKKPWVKVMANLAKIFLTPPPTSADVERLFSTASHVLNKDRNRLLPQNSDKLLFLHENLINVNYQY